MIGAAGLVGCFACYVEDLALRDDLERDDSSAGTVYLNRDIAEVAVNAWIPLAPDRGDRGSLPLHFARNSWEMRSLFGGSSWTGSLGSNLLAIVNFGCLDTILNYGETVLRKLE